VAVVDARGGRVAGDDEMPRKDGRGASETPLRE
jgi:hypothetical protein